MNIKNMERLAEVEYCLGRYLDGNIKGVMTNVRDDLTRKQQKEKSDYESSARGILGGMADAMNPIGAGSSDRYLKTVGKWNSKTTDDYLVMCRNKVMGNKDICHDLVSLMVEWRNAIVREIGQKRYDEASKRLGTDLARAYIDYRLQQTMMDVVIDKETPKSTADYIIRKGAEGSLFGFAQSVNKTQLEQQISKEAEARYKAKGWEWTGARATSIAVDAVTTMGFSSWGQLARLAGFEAAVSGVEMVSGVVGKIKGKPLTIEECISQGVFGARKGDNVFATIRKNSAFVDGGKSQGVKKINGNLKRPLQLQSHNDPIANAVGGFLGTMFSPIAGTLTRLNNAAEKMAKGEPQSGRQKETKTESKSEQTSQPVEEQSKSTPENDEEIRQQQEANQAGWSELMGELGFTGLGDIGHNLGYVIAMLPDMLVGMMTGKTDSLHLRDNMIPIASIVAGMFVKNPILKTVLIGMGGLNLINKVGHESLEKHDNPNQQRFKQYPDEPLNPRISNPVINGNTLIANIDKTPCSILLPENVVAAYQSGALPLNTLANAVLAKHDAGSQMAQSNYRAVMPDNNLQNNRQIR